MGRTETLWGGFAMRLMRFSMVQVLWESELWTPKGEISIVNRDDGFSMKTQTWFWRFLRLLCWISCNGL